MLRLLSDEVQNNTIIEFQHVKIFLTGSSAAGKTSFRRSLFMEPFIEDYESTRLQETKHAYTASVLESKDGEVKWLELADDQQIDHFKSLLKSLHSKKSSVRSDTETDADESEFSQDFERTGPQETKHIYTTSILQSEDGERKRLGFADKQQIDHVKSVPQLLHQKESTVRSDTPSNAGESESSHPQISNINFNNTNRSKYETPKVLRDKLFKSKGLQSDLEISKPVKLITIVDTGGQPEFIHMLPAIINCPTINFVVIDMNKKLTDKVEVRYHRKEDTVQKKGKLKKEDITREKNRVKVEVLYEVKDEDRFKKEDKIEVTRYKTKTVDNVKKVKVKKIIK